MSQKQKKIKDLMIINDLATIIECPSNTDINEWIAIHIVQFYNELSLLCGIIRYKNIICNEKCCPTMTAGLDYEYFWHSKEFIQPIAVSAPKYIDFLLEWIEEIINDRKIFPRINDNDNDKKENGDNGDNEEYKFGSDFKSKMSKICRRIVRVFGHIYFKHYGEIKELKMDIYLNTSFQYFIYFIKQFKLIKDKELYPMRKIVRTMYY